MAVHTLIAKRECKSNGRLYSNNNGLGKWPTPTLLCQKIKGKINLFRTNFLATARNSFSSVLAFSQIYHETKRARREKNFFASIFGARQAMTAHGKRKEEEYYQCTFLGNFCGKMEKWGRRGERYWNACQKVERGRKSNVFLSFFASLSDFPSLRVFNLSPTLLSHPSISLPVKVFPILSGKLLVVSFSQNFPSWLTKFRIDGKRASNFIQPSNFPLFLYSHTRIP